MGVNYTPFSGLPIPDKDAPRDIPYWLNQLGSALDSKLTVYAGSTTERDSKFAAVPIGTLCANTTDGTIWVKTSSPTTLPPTWGAVYTPPASLTWYNINFAAGYTNGGYSGPPQVAQIGQFVYFRGSFSKSNGSTPLDTVNNWGNLPTQVSWPTSFRGIAAANGYQGTSSVGRLGIHSYDGSLEFICDSTSYWGGLDGCFYITG